MKNLSENPIVFMDISVAKEKIGRVVLELFKDKVPKTAENFRALCTGEKGIGTKGKPLHYKNSIFHKIVPYLMVQGGDIINFDGSDGESIYGNHFEDENLTIAHDSEGLLSMVNEGSPNTNSSQFVITMSSCPQLNNTNVVFGKVIRGFGIVNELNSIELVDDKPVEEISVLDCGELTNSNDWGLEESDGTEDVYTPYPEDWNYSKTVQKLSYEYVIDVINKIKKVGNVYFAKKNFSKAERKYKKALRYYDWMLKIKETPNNNSNIKDLRITVLLNLAAVKLNQSKFREAITYCNQVLSMDENNNKALFRRGQSHMGLNEYQLCLADLYKVQELDSDNKDVQREIEKVKKAMKSYFLREKATYKKMFKN